MVTHRDRLVILSFMASPYQNTTASGSGGDDRNDTKIDRTAYIENNDLSHTHLIEKFHPGNFDENDYFDTHEKLEAETVAPPVTIDGTTTLLTTPLPPIKSSMQKPNSILSSATSQNAAENDSNARKNGNNNGRMKNRNNGNGSGGGGGRRDETNRKNADELNKKVDFDGGELVDERTTAFTGITKLPKKLGNSKEARIVDTVVDEATAKKTGEKTGDDQKDRRKDRRRQPSTPISTDSKIIEIKTSTVVGGWPAKKQKRSIELNTGNRQTAAPYLSVISRKTTDFRDSTPKIGMDETILSGDDDTDDDAPPPPPRIYVNVDSDDIVSGVGGVGTQTENTDPFFRMFRLADDVHLEGAETAALIGSAVPINATATAPVHLNGIAAYLNKYLNVNKAIGTYVCRRCI